MEITRNTDLRAANKAGSMMPHGDRLVLRTPFSMKDVVKRLPGALWAPAPIKAWHVPATVETAAAVKAMLEEHNVEASLDRGAMELMARAEESASAQAHKVADDLPEIPGRYCECIILPDGETDPATSSGLPVRVDGGQGTCLTCGLSMGTWMHQRQAYWSGLPREGHLLGMGMGSGKSKVTIAFAEHDEAKHMIILAPERPLKIWPKQFRIHGLRDWVVINHGGYYSRGPKRGKPKFTAPIRDRIAEAERGVRLAEGTGRPFCLVVNYAAAYQEPMRSFLLHPPWEKPGEKPWKVGVVDEGHYIKSPKGAWSKFAAELGKRCSRRLDNTGTPMPHSEPDIYGQARFLDPGVFGTNYSRFQERYFKMGGFEARQIEGFKSEAAEAEFLQKLGGLGYFVEADDVLDLPPALDLEPVTFQLGEEAQRAYQSMVDDFVAEVGDMDENDPVVARNVLSQMIRLSQITSGHLPVNMRCGTCGEMEHPDMDCRECDGTGFSGTQVREIDTGKRDALAGILEGLPQREKAVVFARFTHDLTGVKVVSAEQERRYREVSGKLSDGLDDDGVMVDDVDVMGVQLQAGGTGVDMTAARYAIYHSLDFNLGNFLQTRARQHRPGQRREVFYLYLMAEGTIDETVFKALMERKDVVGSVIQAAKGGEL